MGSSTALPVGGRFHENVYSPRNRLGVSRQESCAVCLARQSSRGAYHVVEAADAMGLTMSNTVFWCLTSRPAAIAPFLTGILDVKHQRPVFDIDGTSPVNRCLHE